ncbi:glycosyltransferase [Oxynema sp. CENA135]|uniref:glycosyltransferase n=1 Tax=Oxynema sp. CENA135 TaxID=984206 RepID=UPI00190BA069|nr:glycosyltransferase [Oxynema sp. CENA135]MBK4732786.1 glycosyltransferase [Oxynema sp. CENA135]
MPKISVVIPVYNATTTIQETISSVLNQSFTDYELIIVNDGSTDETLEKIESFKDPRIRVFSYTNAGAAISRNRGLSQAKGEYIAFLDADDLWTPDKLEAQLAILEKNPQASIAYSWSDCIDESSQFLRRGGHISVNGNVYDRLLLVDFLENGSNPLIRRHALIEIGGFDESLPAGQDWDLYLRLAEKSNFVVVEKSQIRYRISANSLSSNIFKLESACLHVLNRAFDRAPQSLQYLKRHSFGNLYKYLIVKALEGEPEPKKGRAALRFLTRAIAYDPSLLQHRLIVKILLKGMAIAVFSPEIIKETIGNLKFFKNISAVLMYLKIEP